MNFTKKAEFYKALSLGVRLEILRFLLDIGEPVCVCNITKHIKKDQSVIFRHMQILKNAGIIETHKEKSALYCRIKDKEKIMRLLS